MPFLVFAYFLSLYIVSMDKQSVSVIIPTLNEEKHIGRVLDDIVSQTHKVDEVLVVDGGSSDATLQEVLKYPHVTLLKSNNPVARQRNKGGNSAKGEIVFFLDADVRLKNYTIEKLVGEFTKRNLDIACPFYLPYKSTWFITCIYGLFSLIFVLFQRIAPSGAGSAILVKKELFQKSKGFPEDMTYDDIAFIRAAAKGNRFGTLSTKVYVSDRRFKQYGSIKMLGIYLLLSVFFLLGLFRFANIITYPFSQYTKNK